MKNPKYSIIVPVYKAERWLRRCIDSIFVQAIGDFELLLIDDGSPDSSGGICDGYAGKDDRIRVFHKSNGGVSSARNLGIDNARGEYVIFVDSDDYLLEDRLSYLEGLIKEHADMVAEYFGVPQSYMYKVRTKSKDDYSYVRNICVVWTSAFKTSVLQGKDVRFDESLSHGEDTLFILDFFAACDTVIFGEEHGYFYDKGHEDGLNLKFQSYELELHAFSRIASARERIYQQLGIDVSPQFPLSQWGEVVRAVKAVYLADGMMNSCERLKALREIKKQLKVDDHLPRSPKTIMLMALLFKMGMMHTLDTVMTLWKKRINRKNAL